MIVTAKWSMVSFYVSNGNKAIENAFRKQDKILTHKLIGLSIWLLSTLRYTLGITFKYLETCNIWQPVGPGDTRQLAYTVFPWHITAHLQDDAVSQLTVLTQYFVACTEYETLHWQVLLHHILPGEPFWPSHKRIIKHVPRGKTKSSVRQHLKCKPIFNTTHTGHIYNQLQWNKYLKINCNTYNVRMLQCCQKTNFKWNFPSKCRIVNPWLLMDFMFLNELSYHLNARKAI